jgi:hypothetical protein
MISKETFVKTLQTLEKRYKFSNKLHALMSEYMEEFECWDFSIEDTIVDLINEAMGVPGDETLSYCITDLEFLKHYETGCMQWKDGTPIDISTWDKVYEFLVAEAAHTPANA